MLDYLNAHLGFVGMYIFIVLTFHVFSIFINKESIGRLVVTDDDNVKDHSNCIELCNLFMLMHSEVVQYTSLSFVKG